MTDAKNEQPDMLGDAGGKLPAPSPAVSAPVPQAPKPKQENSKPYPDWSNWRQVDVPEQSAISVFANGRDHITIKCEAGEYDEDDITIVIAPENVDALINAIKRERDAIMANRKQAGDRP